MYGYTDGWKERTPIGQGGGKSINTESHYFRHGRRPHKAKQLLLPITVSRLTVTFILFHDLHLLF